MNKITMEFSSDTFPIRVTVTLIKANDQGHLRSHVSVQSDAPQPLDVMLQVQSQWQEWLRLSADGKSPDWPSGWRVSSGFREAPTSRFPNHLH